MAIETILLVTAGVAIAAGTTATIVQSQQQARAQRANARFQEMTAEAERQAAENEARQAANNALQAEMEAGREADLQRVRERRERQEQLFLAGETRATTAAAGLLLEGSPLFVMQEQLRQTEEGILLNRFTSESRQLALRQEAQQQRFVGSVLRYGGEERLRLGRFGAQIGRYQAQGTATGGLITAGAQLAQGAGSTYRNYQYGQSLKTR